jgi:hypothetical protein
MKRAMTIGAMLSCLAVGCGAPEDEGEPVSVATNELRIRGDVAEPIGDEAGVIVTRDSSGGEGDGSADHCDEVQGLCIQTCNNSFPTNPVGWLLVAYRMCIDNCFEKGEACRKREAQLSAADAVNITSVEPITVR